MDHLFGRDGIGCSFLPVIAGRNAQSAAGVELVKLVNAATASEVVDVHRPGC
jgi:hypothetical protein